LHDRIRQLYFTEETKTKNNEIKTDKKQSHPLSGFALAATLWFWSLLIFYTPTYLNIAGGWRIPFVITGWILLGLALLGTVVEVSKIWEARKNRGLRYFGASLFFLIPAFIFFITLVYYGPLSLSTIIVLKIIVLFLTAIGSAILFQGVPYLLWKSKQEQKAELSEKTSIEQQAIKRKEFASIIVFILMLVTAIIQLFNALVS